MEGKQITPALRRIAELVAVGHTDGEILSMVPGIKAGTLRQRIHRIYEAFGLNNSWGNPRARLRAEMEIKDKGVERP